MTDPNTTNQPQYSQRFQKNSQMLEEKAQTRYAGRSPVEFMDRSVPDANPFSKSASSKKEDGKSSSSQSPKKKKKKKKNPWWFYALLSLFIGVFIYAGANLAIAEYRYAHNNKISRDLQEVFFEESFLELSNPESISDPDNIPNLESIPDPEKTGKEPYPYKLPNFKFDGLIKMNADVVGWLYMPAIGVNNVVVKSTDNDYYLHRNIYQDYEYAGTFYLDYRTDFDESDICILYGHSMADGSMFGKLRTYFKQDVADKNPIFWYFTPEHIYECQILTTYLTTAYEDYARCNFSDPEERMAFVQEMMGKSAAVFPKRELDENTRFFMISTCNYSQVWDDGRQPMLAKIVQIK